MYVYKYGGGLRLCNSERTLYICCASWCRQVAVRFAKAILPRGTDLRCDEVGAAVVGAHEVQHLIDGVAQ